MFKSLLLPSRLFFYHLVFADQYAPDILPRAMFLACRFMKLARRAFCALVLGFEPAPCTPCWPNLIILTLSPTFASTTWLFVGCLGVFFGLLYPVKTSPLYSIFFAIFPYSFHDFHYPYGGPGCFLHTTEICSCCNLINLAVVFHYFSIL